MSQRVSPIGSLMRVEQSREYDQMGEELNTYTNENVILKAR